VSIPDLPIIDTSSFSAEILRPPSQKNKPMRLAGISNSAVTPSLLASDPNVVKGFISPQRRDGQRRHMIHELNRFGILVSDANASLDFYRSLDVRVVFHHSVSGAGFQIMHL
jgi:hypothetical protein